MTGGTGQGTVPPPADDPVATRQSAFYVVLTTSLPHSGLVFGTIGAVADAEMIRLLDGPGTRGALVTAYTRIGDALVAVEVEATPLPDARYRIRTWLHQQLLGQHLVEIAWSEG